jgi:hypothetical protein
MELEWNVLSVAFRWWLRRSSEAAAVQQHQTSMTAPFYGERTTKVGALGKNSAGKCVFELSNGMFYRQTGQTGAKKTYLDYFRWHYSIYMVKIQISCYLIYLFAWIKPVAENG